MVARTTRVKTQAVLFAAMLCICRAAAAQAPRPSVPDATAVNAPQGLSSFGGIRPADSVVDGWTVRDLSFRGREISVTVAEAARPPLTIVVSLENGKPGAFDTGGVRIYYEVAPHPQDTIMTLGKAVAERIAVFASGRGGLKAYVESVIEQERKAHPEQNVSREAARRFLDQLAGQWLVTVLQETPETATERTIGTGKAERRRFLSDLVLREDASGSRGSQFMTVGCSPEAARCWLFVLDETSSGFTGGWGFFSESENALKLLTDAREPIAVLRVVDRNRNVLEFYDAGPGIPTRLVKTMRYDRAK